MRWRCCRLAFEELSGIHRHVALQHGGDIGRQAEQADAERSPAGGPGAADGPDGRSRGDPEICCALPDTSGVSHGDLTR